MLWFYDDVHADTNFHVTIPDEVDDVSMSRVIFINEMNAHSHDNIIVYPKLPSILESTQ